ncbi:3-carboxy-cis,cis-muconate cycloisomerase [Mycobacterium sp. DSM 3803]|nr:3-carboxy-cis,cis-muconate cycloisomerase [Mycobacterium sp. DSM 3803]
MPDLFWPGDHRAGDVMSDAAFLDAMVSVETAWLTVLVDAGIAPASARAELTVPVADRDAIATTAERDGNPVTALVALLRSRAGDDPACWLHRGLTSQDVIDTALMLCLRTALTAVRSALTAQVRMLMTLAETYRDTPMLTRTLAQPALPGTVGFKVAHWLTGVLDAADVIDALPALAVQCGGAAGSMAAATELAGTPEAAVHLSAALASALGLAPTAPWHTTRAPLTRTADALVACCDAWGHIANDVALSCRAEIGEFTEGAGGASSTMPHKNNPVLSVLLRRNALTAPHLSAALHTASAAGVDERADGGWHAEWATLRTLTRHTVIAASQATDLLAGLRVDIPRAAANLAAAQGIFAEQQVMRELAGRTSHDGYLGAAGHLIDSALRRAHEYQEAR